MKRSNRVGIFNQPAKRASRGLGGSPWQFRPSDADQRAAPSAAAGDYYGTGFKAKIGTMRSDSVGYRPVDKKQLGTPPTNLA
jgi:hypothetical protein